MGGKSYEGRKSARRAGATGQPVQGTREEHLIMIKQTYLISVLLAVGVRFLFALDIYIIIYLYPYKATILALEKYN